jgi:hypothetical protein
VKIGDDSDLQLEVRGPFRWGQFVTCDAKRQQRLAEALSRGRSAERAEPADYLKELPP